MLILTRKTNQGIVLGNEITIRVLSVDGERVKLGITAPPSVLVLREELCETVRQENESAAEAGAAEAGAAEADPAEAGAAEAGPAGIAALRDSVQAIQDQPTP